MKSISSNSFLVPAQRFRVSLSTTIKLVRAHRSKSAICSTTRLTCAIRSCALLDPKPHVDFGTQSLPHSDGDITQRGSVGLEREPATSCPPASTRESAEVLVRVRVTAATASISLAMAHHIGARSLGPGQDFAVLAVSALLRQSVCAMSSSAPRSRSEIPPDHPTRSQCSAAWRAESGHLVRPCAAERVDGHGPAQIVCWFLLLPHQHGIEDASFKQEAS